MEVRIMEEILKRIGENKRCALAMVTEVEGSSPGKINAMMAVFEDGTTYGTIGGGKLEYTTIKDSLECMEKGISKEVTYLLETGELGLQMDCGGQAKVFIKSFMPKTKLLIVGGGHIGIELAKLGKFLNFHTVVFDDREEYANKERFKDVEETFAGDIKENLSKYPIDENTYIIIVTRGHQCDEIALESVVNSKAKYIGMIGSKGKVINMMNRLQEKGISKEALDKVYAPIGLKLGGNEPNEIAISIFAEVLMIKNGGSLKHMKL
jgi:xanthine dehydrogenase accessory factor